MYCTRRNHSMQTLSFLPLLDWNHVFAYQKQSEATSATEISVSRCLLWKYVMSNKNLSHDLGAAHCACSSIQNLRNEKLFLQYPCQGQFQESGAFYQQMVCWQLCWWYFIYFVICHHLLLCLPCFQEMQCNHSRLVSLGVIPSL